MPHGYSEDDWSATRGMARRVLAEVAEAGATITYEDLAARLAPLAMSPDDPALGKLLGEVSTATAEDEGVLLSAVVVRKRGGRPGRGFFSMAGRLGREVGDRWEFWKAELARVHRRYGGRAE